MNSYSNADNFLLFFLIFLQTFFVVLKDRNSFYLNSLSFEAACLNYVAEKNVGTDRAISFWGKKH